MRMRALVIAVLALCIGGAAGLAADQYPVPVGATVTIDEHGECRQVTNPAGQPAERVVFTKTAAEWTSAINNPNALTLAECAGGGCEHDTWTERGSDRNWMDVASSADGTKLVAVVWVGQIYTSTDSGATWTARNSNRPWTSVASSADGTKLVAAASSLNQLYTSADGGVTWTARDGNRNWSGVASSADGTKLVAVSDFAQRIYTSTNSGVTWTARASNQDWTAVASSADGTKLVATVSGGQIYTSADSGVTWTPRESSRNWHAVASSADGTKLVAGDMGHPLGTGGQIYTSTDSGVTWTPRSVTGWWLDIASSADGKKLVAVGSRPSIPPNTPPNNSPVPSPPAYQKIYISTDSGVTWTPQESDRSWWAVASSADGNKLAAAVRMGKIYTSACNGEAPPSATKWFDTGNKVCLSPVDVHGSCVHVQDFAPGAPCSPAGTSCILPHSSCGSGQMLLSVYGCE